ncbi:cell wall-active antibiotics response protein LiaF [Sutcliffiella cohnii]|uniref:Cell wall-active antibiotics response LiaF-like C-terminal domain-containing protein n=1 Tax=Sutcliffiella cohnii TaxID=33932 RepID=A0A223KMA9_9BACI|nr:MULTISPECIES: cell wall-active antibiotics response protein LiaF [Sutcliffiella]AST90498.1 hypothetical protein BC6307_04005 [Sutcliffiella cohnii]MED4017383.1 cell wall-active antibiotics response protein LiaF [Sutcliffiella cohnii]WBL16150.1 cell wall-active antibiotics response protein LiaF [Sutcliffiella sp. NC1]
MKTLNQKFIAALLVLLGIVLLSINLGVISLEIKEFFVAFYPLFIVLLGLKLLIDKLTKGSEVLFLSLFLLALGSLLCLDRLNIIVFQFSMIWKLWPLLIVYIGIQMFLKKRPFHVEIDWTYNADDEDGISFSNDDDVIGSHKERNRDSKKVFTVGEMKMNKQNWSVEPLKLRNVVGDYYFDFTKAYIPDKETPIHIKGMVADIKMLIPEDLPVKIDAVVKAGQINLFGEETRGKNCRMVYESSNYEMATRKVYIVLDVKVGDVRIDKV